MVAPQQQPGAPQPVPPPDPNAPPPPYPGSPNAPPPPAAAYPAAPPQQQPGGGAPIGFVVDGQQPGSAYPAQPTQQQVLITSDTLLINASWMIKIIKYVT